MTTLRQQMDNAMVLRGFAERTRESYLAAVTALAKHYRRKPNLLTSEEVQTYLLHLIVERKLAYASVNQASCACRFLFGTVLKRPLERFDIPMAKVPQTLPRILSREEVSRLFAHAANLRARTLLMATYAAGLRVSEVCALQTGGHRERARPDVHQGAPGQGRTRPLHDALACPARHLARVLPRLPPGHLAVPEPVRHRADRPQDGATPVLRGTG